MLLNQMHTEELTSSDGRIHLRGGGMAYSESLSFVIK